MQATGTKTVAPYLHSGWFSQLRHEFFGTLFSAFQFSPTNPLNLCDFLFLGVPCQDTAQQICRLYLWVHLSLLLRSACIKHLVAADSWGSQDSVRSSLCALKASFLLISLPEQESISFSISSGSNSTVISSCYDS